MGNAHVDTTKSSSPGVAHFASNAVHPHWLLLATSSAPRSNNQLPFVGIEFPCTERERLRNHGRLR